MLQEKSNGVFPKCFQWICWIQWQKYLITVKVLEPATQPPLVWETSMLPQHQLDTCERQETLNWAQFMLQWFIWFPEFAEFSEKYRSFRKNSSIFSFPWRNLSKNTVLVSHVTWWYPLQQVIPDLPLHLIFSPWVTCCQLSVVFSGGSRISQVGECQYLGWNKKHIIWQNCC